MNQQTGLMIPSNKKQKLSDLCRKKLVFILGICEEEDAKLYCFDCKKNLCQSCSNFIHTKKKDHKIDNELKKEVIHECNIHRNKVISFFCITCTTFVCSSCFLDDKELHYKHRIRENDDIKEKIQHITKSKVQRYVEGKKDFEKSLEIIKEETTFLEMQHLNLLEIQKKKENEMIYIIDNINNLEKETDFSLDFCLNFLMKETEPIEHKKKLKSKIEVYKKNIHSLIYDLKHNFITEKLEKVNSIINVFRIDENDFYINTGKVLVVFDISNNSIYCTNEFSSKIHSFFILQDMIGIVFKDSKDSLSLFDLNFKIIKTTSFKREVIKVLKYHNNSCIIIFENKKIIIYSVPDFKILEREVGLIDSIFLMNDEKSVLTYADESVLKLSYKLDKLTKFKGSLNADHFIETSNQMICYFKSKRKKIKLLL